MDHFEPARVTVEIDAIGVTTPPGSSLRVLVLDVTEIGSGVTEMAEASVPDWDGTGVTVRLPMPQFEPDRDYVAMAHGGRSREIHAGDWVTVDDFPLVAGRARVRLRRV